MPNSDSSKTIVDPSTTSAKRTTKAKPEKFDPFDPESLKLTEKDRGDLGVDITMVELPCRKPNRQEWVRTNPDRQIETVLFKLEESGEFYLVTPEMRPHSDLFETAKPFHIQLAVNRAGSPFLWPAQIPDEGGAGASWHRSGLNCQKLAEDHWVRVVSDRSASSYTPVEHRPTYQTRSGRICLYGRS